MVSCLLLAHATCFGILVSELHPQSLLPPGAVSATNTALQPRLGASQAHAGLTDCVGTKLAKRVRTLTSVKKLVLWQLVDPAGQLPSGPDVSLYECQSLYYGSAQFLTRVELKQKLSSATTSARLPKCLPLSTNHQSISHLSTYPMAE